MIARWSRRSRRHAGKVQSRQIKLFNEDIYGPDRALFRNPPIQILWKRDALPAISTFDEPLHQKLPTHGEVRP